MFMMYEAEQKKFLHQGNTLRLNNPTEWTKKFYQITYLHLERFVVLSTVNQLV